MERTVANLDRDSARADTTNARRKRTKNGRPRQEKPANDSPQEAGTTKRRKITPDTTRGTYTDRCKQEGKTGLNAPKTKRSMELHQQPMTGEQNDGATETEKPNNGSDLMTQLSKIDKALPPKYDDAKNLRTPAAIEVFAQLAMSTMENIIQQAK